MMDNCYLQQKEQLLVSPSVLPLFCSIGSMAIIYDSVIVFVTRHSQGLSNIWLRYDFTAYKMLYTEPLETERRRVQCTIKRAVV